MEATPIDEGAATRAEYARARLLDATGANGRRFAEVLDIDLYEHGEAVAQLCTRLFMEGYRVGMGAVLAQVDEQGIPLTMNIDAELFTDCGPLDEDEDESDG